MELGRQSKARARAERRADAPAETVGEAHAIGIAAECKPAETGELDAAVDLLAEHPIRKVIELTGADVVLTRRRQLHRPAQCQGHGLTTLLREEVDLGPDIYVAEVVAGPLLSNERIFVDDTAVFGGHGREQRT